MADPGRRFIASTLAACALAAGVLAPVWLVKAAEAARAQIIFSGYQSLPNGGGILFVEMTEPVAVEVKRAGQVIEYRLVGASVPLKNNRNPLLLRDFSSSITSAVLVPEKGKHAVKLVVTLRSAISPPHRMVQRGKGAALEIELPPPK
jgi:hypothetical protein